MNQATPTSPSKRLRRKRVRCDAIVLMTVHDWILFRLGLDFWWCRHKKVVLPKRMSASSWNLVQVRGWRPRRVLVSNNAKEWWKIKRIFPCLRQPPYCCWFECTFLRRLLCWRRVQIIWTAWIQTPWHEGNWIAASQSRTFCWYNG